MRKIFHAIFFMVIMAACKGEKGNSMNTVESNPVVTHCIGRSTVSIPISFSPSSVFTGNFLHADSNRHVREIYLLVSTSKISHADYVSRNRHRENEFRELGGDDTDVLRMIKNVTQDRTIFRVQEFESGYLSELSYFFDGTLVVARLNSYDNEFEKAEAELLSFSHGLRKLDKNNASNTQGFCIGDVIVTGEYKVEATGYTFSDKTGTRVSIDVDTFSRNEDIDLLSRVKGPKSLLTLFKVDHAVLRARELQVAGMRTQEWLAKMRHSDKNDILTHKFELETMRSTPSKLQPHITVTLDTAQPLEDGTRMEVSKPDEEAIELWDAIVASIRPVRS